MKSTRRQFLVQSAKAGLAVAAGLLSGKALANRPRPTYEVPEDVGFTAEGWVRAPGWDYPIEAEPTVDVFDWGRGNIYAMQDGEKVVQCHDGFRDMKGCDVTLEVFRLADRWRDSQC